ncbi:LrgB family protein [Bacilli bacterium]|nr:LrgB family protein [Oceanobacillus caeni]PZD88302.1 LrgB family protein [Bacilli bacterium]PZD90397.1 LrgB family protein [Bacilli bacterium]PZD92183.1 LrgB family protein [Bacilli bacterium]RCO07141.1 LrgB family protein [Bacilli bacterium]
MMMIVFTILTYFLYLFSKKVYGKIPFPIFQPLLLAPILLIMLITIMHVSANQYLEDAKWLSHMLGPATIAFAVPIYKHFSTIKKYMVTILISITTGTLVAIFSTYLLSKLIHLNSDFLISILPRSITTPIAIEVSKEIGGLPTLTTVFVIITGVMGGVVGPAVLKWLSIKTPIAKGLALGMGAHGVGTNKAMEYGKQEEVFSSIAMIFAAFITLGWGTLFILFI